MRFTLDQGVTSLGHGHGTLSAGPDGVFAMPDDPQQAEAVTRAVSALGLAMTVLPEEPPHDQPPAPDATQASEGSQPEGEGSQTPPPAPDATQASEGSQPAGEGSQTAPAGDQPPAPTARPAKAAKAAKAD